MSELSPQSSQARQLSHNRLGSTPFEIVATVFNSFQEHLPRGGFSRTKPPVLPQQGLLPSSMISPKYHVEASFNTEQLPYVATSMVYLQDLVEGAIHGETATPPFPLSERVVQHFANPQQSFNQAVSSSMVEVLEDFARRYPNLMPAMHAAFANAGAAGIRTAVAGTETFLSNAIEGSIEDDVSIPIPRFVNPGGASTEHPVLTYEVHCSGIRVANAIRSQAAIAARQLALNSAIRQDYKPETEDLTRDKDETRYKNLFDALYDDVVNSRPSQQ